MRKKIKAFKNFSIKFKLIIIQILTTTVILSIFVTFYIIDEIREVSSFSQTQYRSLASVVGYNCVPALHFLDNKTAGEIMLSLKTQSNILNAWIYDNKGKLFVTYSKDKGVPFEFRFYEAQLIKTGQGSVVISQAIQDESELLGTLFLNIDESYKWNIVKNSIFTASFLMILGIIAAFLLSLRTQKTISKPILHLVEAADYVSSSGDLSKRVKSEVKDEIGILYSGFNKLMKRLQAQENRRDKVESELKSHKERLEEIVEERTIELEKARDQAEAADKLKSAFLASMSHELRTPLNSIIGFTGIILQELAGPLNPEQEKQLKMVQKSSKHLLTLINDILDISKIESGRMEIESVKFDMSELVRETILGLRSMAENKGLLLELSVDENIGEITSDPRRIKQIIINLVNNAIKFTDEGSVDVRCYLKDGFIYSEISDTGIGIKKNDMKHLFGRFRQLDYGLAREREGTGLGLVISRRLAELLNGEITAQSTYGKGSVFTFSFPIVK